MSYRGNWTPGAFMWVGADQAAYDQSIAVPTRRGTALTGARNGLEWHPYVWREAGRARELEVTAQLAAMRDYIKARFDADYGPGFGAHMYGQCTGECRYCALEQAR